MRLGSSGLPSFNGARWTRFGGADCDRMAFPETMGMAETAALPSRAPEAQGGDLYQPSPNHPMAPISLSLRRCR
uniref:Uncharacterized protein n=1 Tax=Globodera pallida TaxID=36090 RepID=A0A183CH53_GLOPA